MHCRRCKTVHQVVRDGKKVDVTRQGRVFVDRAFSDNLNFEASCIICGDRKYISKSSALGRWLSRREEMLANARAR